MTGSHNGNDDTPLLLSKKVDDLHRSTMGTDRVVTSLLADWGMSQRQGSNLGFPCATAGRAAPPWSGRHRHHQREGRYEGGCRGCHPSETGRIAAGEPRARGSSRADAGRHPSEARAARGRSSRDHRLEGGAGRRHGAWMARSDLKLRSDRDGSSPAARPVANEGQEYDLEFLRSWPHGSGREICGALQWLESVEDRAEPGDGAVVRE
jgi:hypothetical protein